MKVSKVQSSRLAAKQHHAAAFAPEYGRGKRPGGRYLNENFPYSSLSNLKAFALLYRLYLS